jgi:hypothetical protein
MSSILGFDQSVPRQNEGFHALKLRDNWPLLQGIVFFVKPNIPAFKQAFRTKPYVCKWSTHNGVKYKSGEQNIKGTQTTMKNLGSTNQKNPLDWVEL